MSASPARRAGLLGLLVLAALAFLPLCRLGRQSRVRILDRGAAEGPVSAGAAEAEIAVPLPAPAVGYGLVRPEVARAALPLVARAVVVSSGGERVGLVSLDLLFADPALVDEVQRGVAPLGLSAVWVTATHSHSSAGGFASNPVAQVAATGRFRSEVRRRVVAAASQALSRAAASARPVRVWAGVAELGGIESRDEFPDVDRRLTRVQLRADAGPVAQLVVLAAHPTLVARPPPGLDPDWPGRVARAEASAGQGVTLVLQGSVGNASVRRPEPGGKEAPVEVFARRVAAAVESVPLREVGAGVRHVRVEIALPGPDASRLVPRLLATLVDNVALCPCAPRWAEVGELEVGGVRLLGVPVEATAASGAALERAAGGARVVSLANGYLGYVEPPERVSRAAGESRRQLFTAGLLDALLAGAAQANAALHPTR